MSMKTAISIPDSLFQASERLASRLGISRSALFQRAIREFLNPKSEESVTKALNRVHGALEAGPAVDPVLARIQEASNPREQW